MCYHAEFGTFCVKGAGLNRVEHQKLGIARAPPLRMAMSDHKNTPLPNMRYRVEFVRVGQTVQA